ncbi:MAG: exodeoxyribonuclease I [Pseudomonadales bacterium]
MTRSFYWYDLETSGTDSRWDRIVQFAGLRTDVDLNEIGEPDSTYVALPDDVLPNPDAALVTGITPARTRAEGITEWQALHRINAAFSEPGTCVVGYNSLRFDDEFVRHGLYRHLMDPYAREWQHGNSRWDIIDLVRATGALRRDGIEWPADDEGLPVYKLERLTQANGIDHGQAHDALSDVRATLALARLIRDRQPKLFDYYLGLRDKRAVRGLLEPFGARLCVHVSGMYPRDRYGTAPVMSLGRHPVNSNAVIVADLSRDVEPLLTWTEDQLREALFRPGNAERPPLKEIRINRCPFVAGIEVLDDENWQRLGLSRRDIKERHRRLRQPGVAQKLLRVYARAPAEPPVDPEAALYAGFIDDADRSRSQALQRALAEDRWQDLDFADERLRSLAVRLKARSFPQWLSEAEREDWQQFVRAKLGAEEAPWLTLRAYRARLAELEAEHGGLPGVLADLAAHGDRLAAAYGL